MDAGQDFGRGFGKAFMKEGSSVDAWADAAASTSGKAKLIADLSVNGLNVGANGMSEAESAGLLPQQGASHNTAEGIKAGATAHAIAGLLGVV